jgi:hypothetical protein
LTQRQSTSWRRRAASSRFQRSSFFTGFLSAVSQPRRFQPWIHSWMPFWTYWLSVCSSILQGRVSASSAWIAAISSIRLLVVLRSPPFSSRRLSP